MEEKGDRFIPMRRELNCFEIKQEITAAAPEGMNEDRKIEQATPNNNQQNQNELHHNYSTELASGENLKKYNILLQAAELEIKDAHLVSNTFLNEESISEDV